MGRTAGHGAWCYRTPSAAGGRALRLRPSRLRCDKTPRLPAGSATRPSSRSATASSPPRSSAGGNGRPHCRPTRRLPPGEFGTAAWPTSGPAGFKTSPWSISAAQARPRWPGRPSAGRWNRSAICPSRGGGLLHPLNPLYVSQLPEGYSTIASAIAMLPQIVESMPPHLLRLRGRTKSAFSQKAAAPLDSRMKACWRQPWNQERGLIGCLLILIGDKSGC